MNEQYIADLTEELLRVAARGEKFTAVINGETIEGATETDVIKHLTSKRDYVRGRKFTFPGIGNGWQFATAIEAAGFKIVMARNARGQQCRVITL